MNSILFTGEVMVALKYRRPRKEACDNHWPDLIEIENDHAPTAD
jgi:hypothetical protein